MAGLPDRTDASFPSYLFSFRGRIGRGRYLIGVGAALIVLVAAIGCASNAMAPTGGNAGLALLALPLILAFIWIFAAIAIQRLRDAGLKPSIAVGAILLPMALLIPMIELIEYAGWLIAAVFAALVIAPALLRSEAAPPPAP